MNEKKSSGVNPTLQGKFIVLDGPDGCGKTTQTRLLVEWLQKQGVPSVSFRQRSICKSVGHQRMS
jgi:thymidylate kinase